MLIEELNKIYIDMPYYGYRRTIEELKDKGINIGQRRILRLKVMLGLHTLYPKKKTTIPDKQHKKYGY